MRTISRILFLVVFLNTFTINSFARDISKGFADLAEKVIPTVVNISTTIVQETKANPFPFQFPPGSPFEDFFKEFNQNLPPQKRKSSALGSGFFINENGYIVTNNHVVQGATNIIVKLTNGKEYDAEIVGLDNLSDIAVLKLKTKDKFPFVKFGDSEKARVGDWVISIGNPFGLGGTVTSGIISAINRDIQMGRYDNFIQTDAPINPGNSGGPLFNLDGEVIGINSAIFSTSGGSMGIGFSIPSNAAQHVIDQLVKYGETRRGWLGVRIQVVTKDIADSLGMKSAVGALVTDINADGPAKKAGIESGDVILEFNNKEIKTMRDLPKYVADAPIGKDAVLKIWRNKKIIEKTVKVGRLEESSEFKESAPVKTKETPMKKLGISVRDITSEDIKLKPMLKNKIGVIIVNIEDNSPFENIAVREGDAIIAIQKKPIKDVQDFKLKLQKEIASGNKSLLFTIVDSSNTTKYIGIKIK